eukprot:EG_transcript_6360
MATEEVMEAPAGEFPALSASHNPEAEESHAALDEANDGDAPAGTEEGSETPTEGGTTTAAEDTGKPVLQEDTPGPGSAPEGSPEPQALDPESPPTDAQQESAIGEAALQSPPATTEEDEAAAAAASTAEAALQSPPATTEEDEAAAAAASTAEAALHPPATMEEDEAAAAAASIAEEPQDTLAAEAEVEPGQDTPEDAEMVVCAERGASMGSEVENQNEPDLTETEPAPEEGSLGAAAEAALALAPSTSMANDAPRLEPRAVPAKAPAPAPAGAKPKAKPARPASATVASSKSPVGKADAWKKPHPNSPQPLHSPKRAASPVRPATAPTTATAGGFKSVDVMERLTRQPRRRELPPLERGKQLRREEQEGLVERLYQTAMDRKKVQHNKTLERYGAERHGPRLTTDVEQEMVQRIFYEQMKHDKAVAQSLNQKYIQPRRRHVLPADNVQSSTQRLFYESMASKQKRKEELFEKYVTSTDPVFKKMSTDALAATATRLYVKS